MPYSVTYDPETDCIYVSIEGELNLPLFNRMAAEVARCMNEHDCRRILNDLRQAIPAESAIDIYSMPKRAVEAGVAHTVKRALLVSDTASDFRFLETVFINRGNIVQLFTSIEDAKRWLFGEKTDS